MKDDEHGILKPFEKIQACVLGRTERGKNVAHNPLYVRLLRQHLPSHHRDRFPFENYVSRGQNGQTSAVGHGRTRKVSRESCSNDIFPSTNDGARHFHLSFPFVHSTIVQDIITIVLSQLSLASQTSEQYIP